MQNPFDEDDNAQSRSLCPCCNGVGCHNIPGRYYNRTWGFKRREMQCLTCAGTGVQNHTEDDLKTAAQDEAVKSGWKADRELPCGNRREE